MPFGQYLFPEIVISSEGYPNVDIDTELPYMGVCDEFDEWLNMMEQKDNAAEAAERGWPC